MRRPHRRGSPQPPASPVLASRRLAVAALALAALGAGCSADAYDESGAEPGGGFDQDAGAGSGGTGGAGGAGGGGAAQDAALPPEEEVDTLAFTAPAAGAEHVWLASPDNDLVVRVDARTRAVGTVEVGEEPTLVRTLPGQDVALALSRGADELSVIVLNEGGTDRVRFHALPGHFNRLDLDPSGAYAYLWFDVADTRYGERTADQQLLAVFDVAADAIRQVAVGFRPRQLVFRGDQVLLVTEDGLSVVRPAGLPAYSVAPLVPLVADPLARQNREVLVGADGRFAVSRADGESGLTVVALPDGVPIFIPLPEAPTDIDLLPSGDAAVAMLRGRRALARIDLTLAGEGGAQKADFDAADAPKGEADAEPPIEPDLDAGLPDAEPADLGADDAGIDGSPGDAAADAAVDPMPPGLHPAVRLVPIGQGTPGAAVLPERGQKAVLYTTVDDPGGPTVVGIYDLGTHAIDYRLVRKAVDGVSIDPAGNVAFLRHRRLAGSPPVGADVDQVLAYSDGYSLLDLRTGFVRLVTTEAQPRGLLYSSDGPDAFVLTGPGGGGQGSVHRLDLNGLAVRSWDLGSPPEVVGLLPAVQRAFVTQTHPSGRISFLDLEDSTAGLQTVSGYTLNSRIE